MNNFIMVFNASAVTPEKRRLLEVFLSNHRLLKGWSSPFPGTYFLKSEVEDAEEISDNVEDFFDKKGVMVAKIGSKNAEINGRSSAEIWSFLKSE